MTYEPKRRPGGIYDVGEYFASAREAAQAGTPAVEQVSGEEKRRELVKRGFIEERKRAAAVKRAIKEARGEG